MLSPPLPPAFYDRDALAVAVDLVGCLLASHGPGEDAVVLRVTEVEAYREGDTANHCRAGRTRRNAPMWGPPGHAYVYTCYGLHQLLNAVTGPEHVGAAVLIRAAEPVTGHDLVVHRRGGAQGPALLAGPGRVGAALGLDPSWSGHPLYLPGGLSLHPGDAPALRAGPRVGVESASPQHRAAPWRIAAAHTRWVSRPGGLLPLTDRVAFLAREGA